MIRAEYEMPRPSIWNNEHADYLLILVKDDLTANEMSIRMSKQFRTRITAAASG